MTKPIRVLHVFGRLDLGGAESRTMDIYRQIDKSKVQFDFVIHTQDECFFSNEILKLGGNVYSIPRFNGKNIIEYMKAWNDFLKEHDEYKIIHGHQTSTAFIYLAIAKKHKVPIRIAHSRNSNKDTIIKKYTAKLSKYFASELLAVSKNSAVSEFGEKLVNNGTVKIIPNGINVKAYSYNPTIRDDIRKQLLIDEEIVIGHIGRFHPQKNHLFVIEIFKEMLKVNSNLKLVFIGKGVLEEEIKKEVNIAGIGNATIFLGQRNDVPKLLQAIDVLILPSLYEGFPGVVLEAQAASVPSVVADNITKEVKITNIVKYVSLSEDIEQWVGEIFKSIDCNIRKDRYNEISKAGYDIVKISKWYEDFYLKKYNNKQC